VIQSKSSPHFVSFHFTRSSSYNSTTSTIPQPPTTLDMHSPDFPNNSTTTTNGSHKHHFLIFAGGANDADEDDEELGVEF